MTKAVFNYSNDLFQSLEISGHSGYQDKGFDIVCSAISTAVFTTLNLIEKLYGNKSYQLEQNEDNGYLSFKMNIETDNLINTIISNLIDVLNNLKKDYPQNLNIKINK